MQVLQYSWKKPITRTVLLKYDGPTDCPYVSEAGFISAKEKSFCASVIPKNKKKNIR